MNPKPSFPRFYQPAALLVLISLGQVLVLLASLLQPQFDWAYFSLASLLVQWHLLLTVCILALAQPLWPRLSLGWAYGVAYGLSLLTALVIQGLWASYWSGWQWSYLLQSMMLNALVWGLLLRVMYLQQLTQWQQQANLQAKINDLQARMAPHFLFNTLNTLASLVVVDAKRAEQAIEQLAHLLRASLSQAQQLISLEQELALCQDYLSLEALRLGARLRWTLDFPEPKSLLAEQAVPVLLIQPLFENAIKHGISPCKQPGWIRLSVQRHARGWLLLMDNSLGPQAPSSDPGLGLALANCRQRLALIYGPDAELSSEQRPELFSVRLLLPYKPFVLRYGHESSFGG